MLVLLWKGLMHSGEGGQECAYKSYDKKNYLLIACSSQTSPISKRRMSPKRLLTEHKRLILYVTIERLFGFKTDNLKDFDWPFDKLKKAFNEYLLKLLKCMAKKL